MAGFRFTPPLPVACMAYKGDDMNKPKIFCFSNVVGGGDGEALALAEDGTCLGSHWCSHESFVRVDLGVTEGSRPDRHKTYKEHYPDGYEMVFVPSSKVKNHPQIKIACELNHKIGEETTDEKHR